MLIFSLNIFTSAWLIILTVYQQRIDFSLTFDRCLPTEVVAIDDTVSIKQVKCGFDGTMFLTDTGALLACGRFVFGVVDSLFP